MNLNLSRLSLRDPAAVRLRAVPISQRRNMYTELRKLLAAYRRLERAEQRIHGRMERTGMTIRELAYPEAIRNASRRATIQRAVRKIQKNEVKQERSQNQRVRIAQRLLKKYNNFMNIPSGNLEKLLKNSINEYTRSVRRVTSGARERSGR